MRKLGGGGLGVSLLVVGALACGSRDALVDSQSDSTTVGPAPVGGGTNFDALEARPIDAALLADLETRARGLVKDGSTFHGDAHLGVPTFLWTGEQRAAVKSWRMTPGRGPAVESAARAVVSDYAELYKLDSGDIENAVVGHVHDTGHGAIVVKLRGELGGIAIFREEMSVVLDRDLEPVAVGGYITSQGTPAARPDALAFRRSAAEAAAIALGDSIQTTISPAHVVGAGITGRYEHFGIAAAAGIQLDAPLRVKQVYYHLPEGLEAGYYVEVQVHAGASHSAVGLDGLPVKTDLAFAYVVSAATGAVLHRHSLTAESAYTYRVWADPTTKIPNDTPAGNGIDPKVTPIGDGFQAPFIATHDIPLANFPFSRNDPWLPDNATETNGNNADVFLNLFAPDGLNAGGPPADPPTGDYRGQITAAGQFLHAQTPDGNPNTNEGRQAAIQQLFYDINFQHDWYYDAGFNEAAGNAQADNFSGRGGFGGDPIIGQVQDVSGYSNANMTTPNDGFSPRMRMFMFTGVGSRVTIKSGSFNGSFVVLGVAMAGPQTFDVGAAGLPLVQAAFNASPTCTLSNAAALTSSTIALLDMDTNISPDTSGCPFATRFAALQSSSAAAVFAFGPASANGQLTNILGLDSTVVKPTGTTPTSLRTYFPAGTLIALHRTVDRDGSLDAEVVFHEFFHYVSNRLISDGSGLFNNQSGGLGEGWSDFNAMMLIVRGDDDGSFAGVYPMGSYVTSGVVPSGQNDGYYFGIRRYPYSTDMTKNPLTLKHIEAGIALPISPPGPPISFGQDGSQNAEVHSTGEVWTTMLWECYAALLRDTVGATPRLSFQAAQDRMKGYLIASLKTTPSNPTLLQARDALLAVALANNPSNAIDRAEFLAAFAKRGAGPAASVPPSSVTSNSPVTEDFIAAGPELQITSTDGVATATAGGSVTYTIFASNAGTVAATGATVVDTFPASLTCSWTCVSAGGGTCTASGSGNINNTVNLPSGGSVTYTASCNISAAATGTLSNTATVAAPVGLTDPTAGNNSATDTDTLVASADLSITKTDGVTTAVPGGSVTYTITASNAGPSSATGATVADTFPATLTCTWTCVGAGGGTCTASGSGNINNTVNLPSGGAVTYTASCAISAAAIGSLSNTATVTDPAGVSDPTPGNNSATDTDTLAPSANLGITKTDGVSTATAGGSVTYTIVASNVGPSNVLGATVADTFPASLTCTWTCAGAGGGTCTASGSGNISDTVSLPSGGSATYTASCNISASATGSISNTATVTAPAGTTDPVPGNNSATDTDTLGANVDLSITKTDGVTTATPGGSVTYTITASNAGPSIATGATIADTFPASLTCTWTCVGAGGGTCTASGSGNINNTVNLPSGGSVTYTAPCSISASATGTLSNTATVTAPAGVTDTVPGNNSATDTDTLGASADLSITKTDGVTTATPGGSVTYTIAASNAGPSNATGATVADTFPASETCTWTCVGTGGGTCTASGSGNINNTVNLPSGGSVTYTASCTISASAIGSLSNTATVTAPAGVTDPTPGNNSATDTDTLAPSANLGITKTDGVTTATAGGSVTYTIVASNAGSSDALGATVADTFPASLTCTWTCVGAGGGTCTASGSGNINNTVNLPSGGSATYTASCAISPSATGTLSNTATVTAPAGTTDPVPGNNSATDSDTLGASADLAITKTDGVTTATPGSSVTYTITASNAGPSSATGATVADAFPASLTCTWTCVGAGGGTCTASGSGSINNTVNLPSGGSVTYTASCAISASASLVGPTGTLTNTATVTAPAGVTDPNPGNNSATDTDTLAASADLSITKTDGVTSATAGGSVTYTITASNAGPSNATGATVADTFPAILTCTWTCAGAGGGTCTASGSGNINNTVNVPSGGSVTYTASCAISASATGSISNTATVTAPGGVTDTNPGNNSATDVDALGASADLSITKTDGVTTATPGGSVTYTITASNAGPSSATGATVADTFPASLTCTWTCVGAGGGTCTASGSGNINNTVNLPSGGSVTHTASCTISASATGTLSNTATVTAPAGVTDTVPGNNSATDTDTLGASADLSITKTDGVTTATAGGSVTYTITASNAGPSTATGATVADTFPASLTCTWTCVGAGGGTCTASGSGNINNTVNLPSGGSVTHTASCTISASATGTLSNTATVTAPAGVTDPVPGNNSATDTDTLGASADLSITKTDGVTTATAGGSVTYTITASNAGPSSATGATVADTFPASLTCTWTCVGAGGGTCTASGSGNINSTVNLPSGGSVTHTASCTISASATGTLSNTATVTAPAGVTDPVPGNNSATDTDTLGASADLAITKTDGVTSATAGGSVTYTITASNAGPSSVIGATVADTFPASLTCTWTCVGAGGGTCTASGSGNINGTENLPSGGSVTYTASCTISASATGSLTNTATVTAPGGVTDPNPGNNSATDVDALGASADLSITKTDGVTTATPGGSVTYTITASNAGPSSATGATVADTFPASLTCTWTCVGAGGGTCTASGSGNINNTVNLPSGGSVTHTASCTISASATGTLSNTATVTAPAGVTDTAPGNNSATDTDTLGASADLAITKTDGVTTATAGGSVTYTVTASNAGPSTATGATVADTFPASLTCTWTCVGAGGGTCTASGSGNINNTVNLPAGGSVTYTASCTISASATGTLSNTATVTAPAGVTDPTPANNSATDTDTLGASADLAITKTDGVTIATPGGAVTYTIVASNAGPSSATGATVADTFPASLTCTWTCVGAGGGTCTTSGSGNINNTVNLPSGGSATYTASCAISASATGTLSNTATVAAPAGVTDPVPANNSATDSDTLSTGAVITATKTVAGTHKVGDGVVYTIVLGNTGGTTNDNPGNEFIDTLPAQLQLVNVTATSGTAVANPASRIVTWNGALATGASTTITITAKIVDAGLISNQGIVAYDSDNNNTNDATKLTDDPTVGGSADPTVFIGVAVCGDGLLSAGEQCDDGNTVANDCCSPSCTFEIAGTVCGAAHDSCDLPDVCNATGTCDATAHRADGTACDDGTVCNGHETCQSGVCTAGAALTCSDGNVCTTDTCDATLGCVHVAQPDNTTCDDGLACGHTSCHNGTCTGGTLPDCDDNNPCTADACMPGGGCQHTPVADHTTCDDGNACNGHEQCLAGVCSVGAPLSCDDGNACTTDTCDALLGCRHPALPDLTSCDDGTVCNGHEQCHAGICTAGAPLSCNDGNACTTDTCDALLGCHSQVVADLTPCDDGTVCNGREQCLSGTCVAGTALSCDDANACTTDTCDPSVGCRNQALADGTACDDKCNGHETCQLGQCVPITPPSCDDGDPCTIDTCDADLGCHHDIAVDGTSCDDGDACNGHEQCVAGACTVGVVLTCDDQNPCTTDTCDAALGCTYTAVADNTPCSDGDLCNGAEVCQAGACAAGTPLDCDDHIACTTDTCNPTTGCVITPTPDACDDGDACTTDLCDATGCTHTPIPDCGKPPPDGGCCSTNRDLDPGAIVLLGAVAAMLRRRRRHRVALS